MNELCWPPTLDSWLFSIVLWIGLILMTCFFKVSVQLVTAVNNHKQGSDPVSSMLKLDHKKGKIKHETELVATKTKHWKERNSLPKTYWAVIVPLPSRYPMFDIVYLTFFVSWDSQYKFMLLEDKLSTGTGKYNIESFWCRPWNPGSALGLVFL